MIAQTGFARAIYPVHAPLDGDVVFAAATGEKPIDPLFGLTELGMVAANVTARAIARGVSCGNRPALRQRAAGMAGSVRLAVPAARSGRSCADRHRSGRDETASPGRHD